MANGGDFELPDDTAASPTDINTLFGVNQAVGQAPVVLRRGLPTVNRPVGFKGPLLPNEVRGAGPSPASADTTKTLTETLQLFYTLDPESLSELQKKLLAGGFYSDSYYSSKPKRPQLGSYDDDSYAAFRRAAMQAARSGKPLPDLINEAGETKAAADAAMTKTPVQFTHPDDLRAALDTQGPNVIGYRPPVAAYENFVAMYHELEAAAANQTDGQGNVVAPPSVSAAAEQYLRRAFPADAYRNGFADAYNAFSDLIGRTAGNG